jgi:hypothetical protein
VLQRQASCPQPPVERVETSSSNRLLPAHRYGELTGEGIDERVKIERTPGWCLEGGGWRWHGGAQNNGFG